MGYSLTQEHVEFFLLVHSIFISQYPSPLPQAEAQVLDAPNLSSPRCRCCLAGTGVAWSQGHTAGTDPLPLGSSSFPLSPFIPKNLGCFTPAQPLLSQAVQVKGMSSDEGQCAQHQLRDGFGFLGASPSSRRRTQEDPNAKGQERLQCREAELEVPL